MGVLQTVQILLQTRTDLSRKIKMVFKFVAVLLLVASFANAQFKHDGECPDNVEVVQNFDVEKVTLSLRVLSILFF